MCTLDVSLFRNARIGIQNLKAFPMEFFFIVGLVFIFYLGLSFLSMRFFRRFTQKSRFNLLLDAAVVILSFLILSAITISILANAVVLSR